MDMETFDDISVRAGTLWGEARNQGDEGMIAVGNVIMNRVKAKSWYGDHIKGVCLKAWQFSCWNENDPNREKILALDWSDNAFCKAVTLSYYFTKNKMDDNTNGATHYHTKTISPNWAEGKTPCAEIGDHLFYNDIE